MKTIILALFLLCSTISYTQGLSDTLSMIIKHSIKFYQHNKEIRFVDISDILKSNPEASKYFRYAKTNRTFSNVFLGLGIISVGYGVLSGMSYAIEKKETSELVAGSIAGIVIGGILIGIHFPLKSAFKKHAGKAIKLFNYDLGVTGYRTTPNLKIGIAPNGFGFVLNL